MEEKLDQLTKEIAEIKARNQKVESDKAWETSFIRKLFIAGITYIAIGFYMTYLKVSSPWLSALVPTFGFILSTLTISWAKNIWQKSQK